MSWDLFWRIAIAAWINFIIIAVLCAICSWLLKMDLYGLMAAAALWQACFARAVQDQAPLTFFFRRSK